MVAYKTAVPRTQVHGRSQQNMYCDYPQNPWLFFRDYKRLRVVSTLLDADRGNIDIGVNGFITERSECDEARYLFTQSFVSRQTRHQTPRPDLAVNSTLSYAVFGWIFTPWALVGVTPVYLFMVRGLEHIDAVRGDMEQMARPRTALPAPDEQAATAPPGDEEKGDAKRL